MFVPERDNRSVLPLVPYPPTRNINTAHGEKTAENSPLAKAVLPDPDLRHQQLRPRHRRRPLLPRHHLHLVQLQHEHPEPVVVQRSHPPAPSLILPFSLLGGGAEQRESGRHFCCWSDYDSDHFSEL